MSKSKYARFQDGRFARMSQAMQRCGFMNRLCESGKTFTVLAPSDEALLNVSMTKPWSYHHCTYRHAGRKETLLP